MTVIMNNDGFISPPLSDIHLEWLMTNMINYMANRLKTFARKPFITCTFDRNSIIIFPIFVKVATVECCPALFATRWARGVARAV